MTEAYLIVAVMVASFDATVSDKRWPIIPSAATSALIGIIWPVALLQYFVLVISDPFNNKR